MVCGGEAMDSLIAENEEMVQQLKTEFPDTTIFWSNEKKSVDLCYPPRRRNWSLSPIPGEAEQEPHTADTRGEHVQRPAETTIKRLLNGAVVHVLGTPEVSERLNKCSIPSIRGRERAHINTYGEVDNRTIEYDTHNIHTYHDAADFIKAVRERISNKPVSVKFNESHLTRNYVKGNRKWNETRGLNIYQWGNKVNYMGKTPGYGLNRLGLNPDDDAISVKSDLSIRGHRDEVSHIFVWKVTFTIKFGDRLDVDFGNNTRKLGEVKQLEVEQRVDYDPSERFSDEHTIMDSRAIYQGLLSALEQLKEKFFKEIKPLQALGMPNIRQTDLSESIALNVIKKIKNIKPPVG